MDLIQVLDPNIADQIAAGEVVNRPASAVKELLENAVDAGAKNITLAILDAGQVMIQVIDDGNGMSTRDAKMAFKRHATSKIKSADDLWQLQTFGFRGEALASIASVSQVELKTKRSEDELGTLVTVNGGSVSEPISTYCNNGTAITVKNLFFNTPARRKFLKSSGYERQVLISEFEKVAMANPDVCFTFQNENEPQPLILRSCSLRERVGAIIKRNIDKSLIPIGLKAADMTISGWISSPSQAGANSTKNSHFFVNGRFMRNMLLQKSVGQAYGKLLPAGQYPFFYIFIDIDPTQIDVNIHPTKTEIKFANEANVWQMVNSAVRKSLAGAAVEPSIDFSNAPVDIPNYNPNIDIESIPIPKSAASRPYDPFRSMGSVGAIKNFDPELAVFDENLSRGYYQNSAFDTVASDFFKDGDSNFGQLDVEYVSSDDHVQHNVDWGVAEVNISVFQLPNGYIAAALDGGIAIIDYRRAIERITYEKIINTINGDSFASQMELIPQQVELSQSDAALILSVQNELAKLGFEIADMGKGVVALYAMPAALNNNISPQALIEEILDELEKGAKIDQMFQTKIANAIARSASRQKIETLSVAQMQSVVSSIFSCKQPYYNNNSGTIIEMVTMDEIEKRFKKR